MAFWHIALIGGVGIIAGFLNTVAGGGSLLTLPTLIFLGLPSATANGTNRIAIFIQNINAILGFQQKGISNFGFGMVITLPALVGAWVGANIAIDMDDALFNKVLAGVMLLVLGLILFNPTRELNHPHHDMHLKHWIWSLLIFFLVGVYGGFIQAGVGFIVIAALTLISGFNLVRANAIKVLVIFFYTMVALVAFIREGRVDWTLGLILGAGNSVGAWVGSHWAVDKGDKWIKRVLVVAVLALATKLLFAG